MERSSKNSFDFESYPLFGRILSRSPPLISSSCATIAIV
jgi:hypothetical protein